MTPIFAMSSHRAQFHPAAAGTKDPSKVQQAQARTQETKTQKPDTAEKPIKDEYLPEEKQEPSGRYWMEKTENGRPKIYFDDAEKANRSPKTDKANKTANPDKTDNPNKINNPDKADNPDKTDAPDSEKKSGGAKKSPQKPEPEICKGNNDKAEREIKKLKEKKKTLEQQIQAETDEVKAQKLEQELKQVENELRQKDNNSYLRQHTTFT